MRVARKSHTFGHSSQTGRRWECTIEGESGRAVDRKGDIEKFDLMSFPRVEHVHRTSYARRSVKE